MTDDVSPGSAKCVRQKRCEAETGALQKFIDAILLGGNVANDALTIPGQMPQFPEGLIWDKTSLATKISSEGVNLDKQAFNAS